MFGKKKNEEKRIIGENRNKARKYACLDFEKTCHIIDGFVIKGITMRNFPEIIIKGHSIHWEVAREFLNKIHTISDNVLTCIITEHQDGCASWVDTNHFIKRENDNITFYIDDKEVFRFRTREIGDVTNAIKDFVDKVIIVNKMEEEYMNGYPYEPVLSRY